MRIGKGRSYCPILPEAIIESCRRSYRIGNVWADVVVVFAIIHQVAKDIDPNRCIAIAAAAVSWTAT